MQRHFDNRTHRLRHGTMLRTAATVCFGVWLNVQTVAAADAARDFHIPAQSLNNALMAFAADSGLEVVFNADGIRGLNAKSLEGRMTPEQALDRLLQGSGYGYRYINDHTVTLEKRSAPINSAPGASTLPPMTVTGNAEYDSTDPYNPDYNRPNATTATKTDTPIMETPANIQIIPRAVLNDQQVVRLEKAFDNVSGVYTLTRDSHNQSGAMIRGFLNNEFYRNGTRVSASWLTDGFRETANLERVEVLKGVSSILYGRVEPGGMVNVVTKQPLSTPYYSLQQQFGSFDFYRTMADATGAINDDKSLLYRLNFAYEDAGSFRDFVNNDRVFFAPVLRWNIGDKTQATLELEYKHGSDTFDQGLPAIGTRPAAVPRNRNLAGPQGLIQESDSFWAGLNWSHAFNDRWSVSHKFNALIADFPLSPGIAVAGPANGCNLSTCNMNRRIRTSNWSGEQYYTSLDLTGKVDAGPLQHTLLFGWDYYNSTASSGLAKVATAQAVDLFNPIFTETSVGLLNNPNTTEIFSIDENWYGFYVQDQVKLPFNIQLLAGFRYDDAEVATKDVFTARNSPTDTTIGNQRADAVKPRFGVVWQPLHELSFYGNYVENFGLANTFNKDQNNKALPPQTAEQWEVGMKTQLFNDRLTASLAWFDLTKHNIATPHPDPDLANRGISINTGEVRNQGLELDMSGEVYPGLNVIGSYALTDSEITRDNSGNKGNRFFNVPKHGGSFWATYELQSGDMRGLKFGAGMIARGQREGNNANKFQLPGFATFNLMTAYSWYLNKSKITTQLNIDNVLDKHYYASSQNSASNGIFPGAPLTFLGSVKIEF